MEILHQMAVLYFCFSRFPHREINIVRGPFLSCHLLSCSEGDVNQVNPIDPTQLESQVMPVPSVVPSV